MASSLNKVTLIGNVGRDPEIRFAADGLKIAQLSLATSENWKDRVTGERKEKTEWHRVVVFNERLSEIVEKYVRKGQKVYIEGQLQTRKWSDTTTGQDRYTTEIVISKFKGELLFLDARPSNNDNRSSNDGDFDFSASSQVATSQQIPSRFDDLEDEVPF